jgi:hypothetical protein
MSHFNFIDLFPANNGKNDADKLIYLKKMRKLAFLKHHCIFRNLSELLKILLAFQTKTNHFLIYYV